MARTHGAYLLLTKYSAYSLLRQYNAYLVLTQHEAYLIFLQKGSHLFLSKKGWFVFVNSYYMTVIGNIFRRWLGIYFRYSKICRTHRYTARFFSCVVVLVRSTVKQKPSHWVAHSCVWKISISNYFIKKDTCNNS